MKRRIWLAGVLVILLWATPVKADTGVIVRTSNLAALQALCVLPTTCTVVRTLDGALGQVFLVTTPLPLQTFLGLLNPLIGFVGAEADQLLNLVVGLNVVPTPLNPALMSSNGDRMPVVYPTGSTTTAWYSYVNQPAESAVEVQNAQSLFHVTGTGIVADIDTGVDPNHSALQGVLLQGYDFTRNLAGGSEMTDVASLPTPSCTTTCSGPVQVNQSSAAILDQSSAAILDNPQNQYSAFGHGTMVMGVIHLVAPTAQLLPLKAFKSDGTANLSDILRAIYYAAQNNANVINMSFDTKIASTELKNALDYANQLGLISVASAGNDGMQETVYPAALQSDVMGVASVGSTSTTDSTRSSFSNYGNAIVWVAAPGEQIITTYPFSTYAAGWGTSFSAPFVSGGAALLRSLATAINQSGAAGAVAHAAPLTDPTLGKGRLDLVPALQSISGVGGSPDYTVSAGPSPQTIAAGGTANFTVSVAPQGGFSQTVTLNCSGAPAAAMCSVSPSSVMLDGTHAATATVTLKTTARSLAPPLLLPPVALPAHPWVPWATALACLAIFLLVRKFGDTARLRPGVVATAGVLAVSFCTYSCGGYGNGGGPGPGAQTLSSMTLNPTSVTGGSSSTGTVTLSAAAPYGGSAVSLSSNMSAATVPANVTVAYGATSATFTVSTSAVTSSTPVTITATLGSSTKTAALTVIPGTPAGKYTLTLTGTSGNLSHSSTVQVTVN